MSNNAGSIKLIGKTELPERLKEIADPPESIHILGNLPESGFNLCVVGSRRPTVYGVEAVNTLIKGLRGYAINIISGLAIGIDTLAHEAALSASLKTIAVPGSSLGDSVLYPSINRSLARRILQNDGALISEFDDDFRATPWSFPQRNRIMAGLSDAVLLIEAEIKSGTLITARLASEYNRDVLVVPGSIFSANSKGTNLFLKLGAVPITSSADILKHFNLEEKVNEEDFGDLSDDEKLILENCKSPREINQLFESIKLPIERASAVITMLEIKGFLQKTGSTITRVK